LRDLTNAVLKIQVAMKLSFQKLFFILIVIFGLFAILMLAKPVLIPLSLALFISFILLPVVKKLEGWGLNKLLSAFVPILTVILILAGSITLFSAHIMRLSDQLEDFKGQILNVLTDAIVYINNNVNLLDDLNREELVVKGKEWINESGGSFIQSAFSSTAALLTGLFATIIFTFLILIYRVGLTKAFVAFGDDENKSKILGMLKNIQKVGQKYLSGMFLLIIVMGLINSIGLWIIGIDSPFLFGFLAGVLVIVPYLGTPVGAILPILYAFMTSDASWVPIAVIIFFWVMLTVESNYLNPKIVGSSVNLNPLVAILSLLIGAKVWGIAGMVLFLPFAAMFKVVCDEFEQLKPIAMIMSDNISGDKNRKCGNSKWIEKIKRWFRNK
jgi:predicted PurR-regulated permease PerM